MAKMGKRVRIFSALEVANICGVVNQTAINWIKNGHLKAFMTPGGQYRIYAEDLLEFLTSRGMRVPDEIRRVAGSKEKSVLIVEDEKSLSDMLRETFLKEIDDCEVTQAFDGFEAGKLIADRKPSVIILDIGLPGVDGHKLCKRIKSESDTDVPKIIAISGLPNAEAEKEKILAEGADLFFAKPLDTDTLVKAIEDIYG